MIKSRTELLNTSLNAKASPRGSGFALRGKQKRCSRPRFERLCKKTALATQIHTQPAGKKCEAFVAPFDVRFPEADETDEEIVHVVQPDISVVCDPSKIDDRGCRGAPDIGLSKCCLPIPRQRILSKNDYCMKNAVSKNIGWFIRWII